MRISKQIFLQVLFTLYLKFAGSKIEDGGACSSNPCLNNGICTQSSNGFICTCINGYTGIRCGQRADKCPLNVGLNCVHGHCRLDNQGNPSCRCYPGFGGVICDINLTNCDLKPCVNNGSCIDEGNSYRCLCPSGTSGANCQINTHNTEACKANCSSLYNGGQCWHNSSETVKVAWGYGERTCSTRQGCFDIGVSPAASDGIRVFQDYIDVQLKPVQMQLNDKLVFLTDQDAVLYGYHFTPHILPVEIPSEKAFLDCNKSNAIPVAPHSILEKGELTVNKSLLKVGTQYFIAEVNTLYRCEFGLRLNVTVKDYDCLDPNSRSQDFCNGNGRCYTDFDKLKYECQCCDGYTGKYCEKENPCYRKPCKNGGVCEVVQDTLGNEQFNCRCPIGYTGFDCSKVRDYCDSSPCLNGATCQSYLHGYTCQCKTGFHGRNCEVNENLCASGPCRNGAACVNAYNSFTCQCKPGFKGTLCEVNIDECANHSCENGTCIDNVNSYSCHCGPGFTGKNCDVKLDECQLSPCVNGRCVKETSSFSCSCGIGYTGHLCEIKINLCINTQFCLVQNSLACIDHGNNVTCTCINGYTGQNCGINFDECASNPCANGGQCIDKLNGFECRCVNNYRGAFCEIAPPVSSTKSPSVKPTTSETSSTTSQETLPPMHSANIELMLISDNCRKFQVNEHQVKHLQGYVVTLVNSACKCGLSDSVIVPNSVMVVCQDDIRGTFKAEMNLKDKEMKKNVFCSMKTFIESGKVPTTDHNTYIVGINANDSFCRKTDEGLKKDVNSDRPSEADTSTKNKTGIIIGAIGGLLFLIVAGIIISVRFRNRSVRDQTEKERPRVTGFVNPDFEDEYELAMTGRRSSDKYTSNSYNNPYHSQGREFDIDNPGGRTSKV